MWANRFICAKTQKYKDLKVIIIGIDTSSAFDTIKRKSLIKCLENLLDEDELRMCHLLLSKTTIKIKFDDHDLDSFLANIGSPQGDIGNILQHITRERIKKTSGKVDRRQKH